MLPVEPSRYLLGFFCLVTMNWGFDRSFIPFRNQQILQFDLFASAWLISYSFNARQGLLPFFPHCGYLNAYGLTSYLDNSKNSMCCVITWLPSSCFQDAGLLLASCLCYSLNRALAFSSSCKHITLHLTVGLLFIVSFAINTSHSCNLWCLMVSYSVFTHRHFCSYFILTNFNVCFKYLQVNVTLQFDSLC